MRKNYLRKWRYDNITNEGLNTALYEKVFEEQEKYRGWLLSQPAEEILNHAYEYTVREDILLSMEYSDLEAVQAAALLRQEEVMPTLFGLFEDRETNYMDVLRDCITTHANTILREEQALRALPVYPQTGTYAREHDELEQFRASRKANIACKEAVEDAVRNHYGNNCLDTKTAVQEVVDRFGYERMLYVLAVTVNNMGWDQRISRDNKAWAKTVPIVDGRDGQGYDHNVALVVDKCHPGLTDLFVTAARKEYALTQQAEKREAKPSSLEKLKQPVVASPKRGKKKPEPER